MEENRYFVDGPYRELLELFVAYKRGKGEKGTRNLLVAIKKIGLALADKRDIGCLDEATVRYILDPLEGESDSSREHRVSIMRQLSAFLNSIGVPCWQVPPRYYVAPRSYFRPYILAEEETAALIDAADSLPRHRRSHGYELVYPILVRLLVSTGLRISEALQLGIDGVDTCTGVLSVIHSKNQVSRFVPMSESMAARMRAYIGTLDRDSGPLFRSSYTGDCYTYDGVHYMFEKLYSSAGIMTEKGCKPRIHDIRHTFCTRSLEKMLDSGMNFYEAIPILAAYVGHVNLIDTEKYIHLTTNEHDSFVKREEALSSLIPKAVL